MYQYRSCLLSNWCVDKNSVHVMYLTEIANSYTKIGFYRSQFKVIMEKKPPRVGKIIKWSFLDQNPSVLMQTVRIETTTSK